MSLQQVNKILSSSYIEEFFAVAEECSYAKAAIKINKHRSSVQRNIKSLEDLIGCELFVSNRTGTFLNDTGRELFDVLKKTQEELSFFSDTSSEEESEIVFPAPYPCASVTYGAYVDEIKNDTCTFNFLPKGKLEMPDWISVVYEFDNPVNASAYSFLTGRIDVLLGDFNEIMIEFHGEDQYGNMNRYSKPVVIVRQDNSFIINIILSELNIKEILSHLKEVCIVIPHKTMQDVNPKGSFKISNFTFK